MKKIQVKQDLGRRLYGGQGQNKIGGAHIFIYGPQCEKMRILGYLGGPGWPINNPTGPILLPRHPLTYINLHIKYGSNLIRIF